jgi:hypothetical protein
MRSEAQTPHAGSLSKLEGADAVLRGAPGPLSEERVTATVAGRKGLQDRAEVLASLQKTT